MRFELGERRRVVRKALETAQFAKCLVHLNAFVDGHLHAIDIDSRNIERGFFVAFAEAIQQVVPRRDAVGHRRLAQREPRVAEEFCAGIRKVGKGLHEGALCFVELVKHGVTFKNVAVQYNSNLKAIVSVKAPPFSHLRDIHARALHQENIDFLKKWRESSATQVTEGVLAAF